MRGIFVSGLRDATSVVSVLETRRLGSDMLRTWQPFGIRQNCLLPVSRSDLVVVAPPQATGVGTLLPATAALCRMLPATLETAAARIGKGECRMGWRRHLLCCVIAAAWAVTASASQRPPVKSDQQILVELEQGWNEAVYRKDLAFIEDILADEFIGTYEDGSRGDKARELALVAEFNQHVESAIQDEFTVRVYRDTAVVWFTLRLVGIRQGERAEVTLRYTDVWVLRDGRWKCVSAQSTKVNPR